MKYDTRVGISIKDINKDCRLVYNSDIKEFILFVPHVREIKEFDNRENWISSDPGCRSYQTCYTSNKIVEIGTNCSTVVTDKLKKLDKLDELKKTNNSPKIKRCYTRTQRKLENVVNELHYKTCNYLCKNYKTIIIGKLSTKDIVNKKTSKLLPITKRVALSLRHYEFRNRLKAKCEETGTILIELPEHYTSKTCSKCGTLNETLGASKTFSCDDCKIIIDRDYNAAKNILIKSITDNKLIIG
jgi:IS605 OrfB family transposase